MSNVRRGRTLETHAEVVCNHQVHVLPPRAELVHAMVVQRRRNGYEVRLLVLCNSPGKSEETVAIILSLDGRALNEQSVQAVLHRLVLGLAEEARHLLVPIGVVETVEVGVVDVVDDDLGDAFGSEAACFDRRGRQTCEAGPVEALGQSLHGSGKQRHETPTLSLDDRLGGDADRPSGFDLALLDVPGLAQGAFGPAVDLQKEAAALFCRLRVLDVAEQFEVLSR